MTNHKYTSKRFKPNFETRTPIFKFARQLAVSKQNLPRCPSRPEESIHKTNKFNASIKMHSMSNSVNVHQNSAVDIVTGISVQDSYSVFNNMQCNTWGYLRPDNWSHCRPEILTDVRHL